MSIMKILRARGGGLLRSAACNYYTYVNTLFLFANFRPAYSVAAPEFS